ncbi:MAG: DUF5305 family protein [Peptococcia bacterium]
MGKHIKRKRGQGLLWFTFILWIAFSVLTVRTWQKPLVQEEIIKENPLVWTSNYDYVVEVNPCILYPEGGARNVTDAIFPTLTKKIIVSVETELSAEKPVSAQGSYQLLFQVTAEDLWTKDFPLTSKKNYVIQGKRGKAIQEEVVLDLEKINEFIAQVEKETGNSRRTYYFTVKPELTGTLTYNKKTLPLQEDSALQFAYEANEINLVGEQNFSTDLFFEKKEKKLQSFVLAGHSFSLVGARRLFPGLSLLFLMLWVYQIRQHHLIEKGWRESQKIDKKYGSRLIYVVEKVNIAGKTKIRLKSFQSLLQIAEEREVPIFCRAYSTSFKVVYFVPDSAYLYYYLVEEQLTTKQVAVRAKRPVESRNIYG